MNTNDSVFLFLSPSHAVRRTLNQQSFRWAADVVNAARYNLDAPDVIPAGSSTVLSGTPFIIQTTVKR